MRSVNRMPELAIVRRGKTGLELPGGVIREDVVVTAPHTGDGANVERFVAYPTSPKARHVAFPDAFRTVAIAAVITAHLGAYATTSTGFTFLGTWGVDCFFVLSGFLLGRPYLLAVLDAQRPVPSSSAFWMRRFLRIYPLYAVCVILTVLPELRHHGISFGNIIAHLTMTHGFFIRYAGASFNGPLWTMAVDAEFYLVLPCIGTGLVAICRKRDLSWRRRAIWATLAFAVVISLVERTIAYQYIPANPSANFATTVVYARNLIGMASGFALGFAVLYLTELFGRPSRVIATSVTIAGILLLLLLLLSGGEDSPVRIVQIVYDLIGALSGAALLYGLGEGPFPAVGRIVSMPFFTGAAGLAYGVYLFHKPVTFIGLRVIGTHLQRGSPPYGLAMVTFTLPVVLLIAFVGHRYIEGPFLRLKARI
jgi:peptidoglycan/LPS O-acetylase OafA/YrhL